MKTPSVCCTTIPSLTSGKLSMFDGDSPELAPLYPCFCELPASWFLAEFPTIDPATKRADELEASDLFELLCDCCYHRAVTQNESVRWQRIAPKG
ncbi:MAG: hypothetical protein V4671_32170 [Armatimonadota bacterium]